jgi:soluble lytic murein transglycosylase
MNGKRKKEKIREKIGTAPLGRRAMKVRYRVIKYILACLSFCFILVSRVAIASPSVLPRETPQDRVVRITQAKELLGKYYQKSAVSKGERVKRIRSLVLALTRRGLPPRWRKSADKVARTILMESRRHRLDPVFLVAVISNESSFRPDAKGPVGEIGLMQLRPDTAKEIARRNHLAWRGEKTLLDPVMNIRIGAAYIDLLRSHFERHGRLYLAAYNMGPRNTRLAVSKGVWPKGYPMRVMRYYIAFYSALRDAHLRAMPQPEPLPTVVVAAAPASSSEIASVAEPEEETPGEATPPESLPSLADHELAMLESGVLDEDSAKQTGVNEVSGGVESLPEPEAPLIGQMLTEDPPAGTVLDQSHGRGPMD